MEWKKEKPINRKDLHIGCLTCSTACLVAPMEMIIAVGFGYAGLHKNGEEIWRESDSDEFMTVQEAEDMAAKDPDHDWKIIKDGPMHGETFQRHGANEWVCIASNNGFA